jgi:hypothetical protein
VACGRANVWLQQSVARTAYACASLLHHPGELLDAIADDMALRTSDYGIYDWTSILWAFTRLGHSPGRLYSLLASEIEEGRLVMDAKLTSTLVWSLAIFKSFESPLFDDVMRKLKKCQARSFDSECLRRLYQVLLTPHLGSTSATS